MCELTISDEIRGRTSNQYRATRGLRRLGTAASFAIASGIVGGADASAQTRTIEQLEALISAQQTRIEQQQQQARQQQQTLEAIQNELRSMKTEVTTATARSTAAAAAAGTDKPQVSNGEPRVKLTLSGQVNRMVNFADDGDSAKAHFVDNQNSTSRFRFVGTGQISPDLTVGSRIEIGVRPNSSNAVSQDREDAGDSFDQRVVEVFAESKEFGRVLLGKGPTAADGAHEVDLSGTDVITYASISDLAGGLQFRDGANNLTGITIANGFTDYDASRRDRLRYDSPKFAGFSVSGAVISDQRWDTAVYWAGQNETWKAAAAVAFQEPQVADVDGRYGGSFSVLHQPTGLNLTMSAAADAHSSSDSYNFFVKAGLLRRYFELGTTALSIDYTYSGDVRISAPDVRADGHSFGLYAVQNVADYGIDLYGGFRWLTLDPQNGTDLQDIKIVTVGSRVKF